MTDANKRANVASELGRADESMRAARVLVDAALLHDADSRFHGRDFVLTDAALREDLASCQGFLDRAHLTIAGFLGC